MDHNSICILNPNEGKKKGHSCGSKCVICVVQEQIRTEHPHLHSSLQEDNVLSHDPYFSYYQQFNEGVQYFAQLKWRLHPTI